MSRYVPPKDYEVAHNEQGLQLIPTRRLSWAQNDYVARTGGHIISATGQRRPICGCGHPFAFYHQVAGNWTCEGCGSDCGGAVGERLAMFTYDPDAPGTGDLDSPGPRRPMRASDLPLGSLDDLLDEETPPEEAVSAYRGAFPFRVLRTRRTPPEYPTPLDPPPTTSS